MRVFERVYQGPLAVAQVRRVFASEICLHICVLIFFEGPESGEDLAQLIIFVPNNLLNDAGLTEALLELLERRQMIVDRRALDGLAALEADPCVPVCLRSVLRLLIARPVVHKADLLTIDGKNIVRIELVSGGDLRKRRTNALDSVLELELCFDYLLVQ